MEDVYLIVYEAAARLQTQGVDDAMEETKFHQLFVMKMMPF